MGIAVIIFGALQTIALFFTFWIMRQTSRRQLRAYILVDVFEFAIPKIGDVQDTTSTSPWYMHVVLRNFGQTPAFNVTVKYRSEICAPKPENDVLALGESPETQSAPVIGPNDHPTTIRTVGLENGRIGYDANAAAGNRAYIWGRIDYADTFGAPHYTTFQAVTYFGQVPQFGYCKKGNGTDDKFPTGWRRRLRLS